MPQIDVADETWIDADPERLAAIVSDPVNWRRWWPDLDLVAHRIRGAQGVRWLVRASDHVPFGGSMEIWLEPAQGGVVVHYFLRLDRVPAGRVSPRLARRTALAHRRRVKSIFWSLKDRLEGRDAERHES